MQEYEQQEVAFVVGLKAAGARAETTQLARLCRRMLDGYGRTELYEWYRADTVGKVVFDVDGKASETTAAELLARALEGVRSFFAPEPAPAPLVAASHGGDKLSFRLYVPGFRMVVRDIKARIARLGLDVFDPAIYGSRQKLRMAGSIKTRQDQRPLLLQDVPLDDRGRPSVELLAQTLLQAVDPGWPLLTEGGAEPPAKRRKKASPGAPAPPEPTQTAPTAPTSEEELDTMVGFRPPADRSSALALLSDNGFLNPRFVGLPRQRSLTFDADNRSRCPCCALDHERQQWMAMEDAQGVLFTKSYSPRCKMIPMRPVQQIAAVEAAQRQITARVAQLERRQGQTELGLSVIRNTLVDFAPHIEAALNQDMALSTVVMRPDALGFDFNCTGDQHSYKCEVLVNPTCRVSCASDRTVRPVVAGWMGNTTIHDIVDNPAGADSAYADWFRLHQQRQLGVEWRYDKDFFFSGGGTWTRVEVDHRAHTVPLLEQQVVALLQPRLALLKDIAASGALPSDMPDAEKKRIKKGTQGAYNHLMGSRATRAIVQSARIRWYEHGFADLMDRDRHLMGAPNGIIDLRTGALLEPGAGKQAFVSMRTKCDYRGLGHPTPDVDSFFGSVFDGDREMIDFFRLFLGQSITGEKTELFACFTGQGANGKSVTLDWIAATLGPLLHPRGPVPLLRRPQVGWGDALPGRAPLQAPGRPPGERLPPGSPQHRGAQAQHQHVALLGAAALRRALRPGSNTHPDPGDQQPAQVRWHGPRHHAPLHRGPLPDAVQGGSRLQRLQPCAQTGGQRAGCLPHRDAGLLGTAPRLDGAGCGGLVRSRPPEAVREDPARDARGEGILCGRE